MTMVPLGGMLASAAGTALSQTSGSETERALKESLSEQRISETDQHAERSAGIGQTEQDQGTSDRDADGRRLWEKPPGDSKKSDTSDSEEAENELQSRQSKDPTGQSGTRLDLTG
jgi:hypothetical protein